MEGHAKIDGGGNRLLLAAENGRTDIVECLINGGADLDCSHSQNKYTVMHYASEKGWFKIVQSLLNKGTDIEVKTSHGDTPLLLAAKNQHKDIVELLINVGADINCSDVSNNYYVLHYASKNGWFEIVQFILKKGACIDVNNYFGATPLIFAARRKHKDIVKLLINAGADIHCIARDDNCTVLHYASKSNWPEIVQSLLKKGADIQVKNYFGESPLILAAKEGHKDIVKLLINAGADIHCIARDDNYTVLHYASESNWPEIVQSLLKKDADIQVKNSFDESPLLLAAKERNKDIVQLLINAGADINCSATKWNEFTVLHYASRNGWCDIVESLLKKGANIDTKCGSGKTSLHLACDQYDIKIVEHLINAGADVNVQCHDRTSLFSKLISKSPDIKIVRLLIKSGAYLKTVDYERMLRNSLLKEHILQDIELCTQAIINRFNHKGLPELYKLSTVSEILPRIEEMRIGNNSQTHHEVLQSVEHEIQVKGYCNVLKVIRPNVLKLISVQSLLRYFKSIKKLNDASNKMKRPAEIDNDHQQTKHSSKIMCIK